MLGLNRQFLSLEIETPGLPGGVFCIVGMPLTSPEKCGLFLKFPDSDSRHFPQKCGPFLNICAFSFLSGKKSRTVWVLNG